MPKTRILCQPVLNTMTRNTFVVPLPSTLRAVRKVKLLQAVVPNTTYNVQLGLYDTLQVIIGGNEHAVVIPEGSYNLESLFARLKSDLDALNVGTWTFSYSPTTFKCTISLTAGFMIVLRSTSLAYLLGFQAENASVAAAMGITRLTTEERTTSTGSAAVRLNTNRGILLGVRGFEVLECPNLRTTSSFFLPMFSSAGDLNFVSASDLGKQSCIRQQDGHDLNAIELSVKRTDFNLGYSLNSDTSFLFELTHE